MMVVQTVLFFLVLCASDLHGKVQSKEKYIYLYKHTISPNMYVYRIVYFVHTCVHEVKHVGAHWYWGIPPWWECHWGNWQGYPLQFWYNARTGASQWEPPDEPRWYYVFEDWDGNIQ